jgi:ribosomal protein S18 acetylase RimI-like enzyme
MDAILQNFSAPALANAVEANQIAYLMDMGRSPHAEVRRDPDMIRIITGVTAPGSNRIVRAQFDASPARRDASPARRDASPARRDAGDVDARIEAALGYFKARRLPVTWHTGPSTRPLDLGQRLVGHGLTHAGDEPGMAMDLLALPVDILMHSGLAIERVGDLDSLEQWCSTVVRGFGWPERMVDSMARVEADLGAGQHEQRRLYMGYLRGRPVATALVFLGAGVAGLYAVVTRPEARRQGIGRAMTLRALLDARVSGYRIGTLHASAMGFSMYAGLGFQVYCQLGRYIWTGE